MTTIFVHENINSLFVYEQSKLVVCEREAYKQGTAKIYSTLSWIYSKTFFFVLLSQGTDTGQTYNPGATASPGLAPKTVWFCWLPTDCSLCWLITGSSGMKTSVVKYFPNAYAIFHTQYTWHFHCFLFTLRHICTSCFEILTNRPVKGQYVTIYIYIYIYALGCVCVWMCLCVFVHPFHVYILSIFNMYMYIMP